MPKHIVVMPSVQQKLKDVGEQIKYARLRRQLSITLVSERSGLSRQTVYAVEAGNPNVSIGAYAAVLMAIGMPDEISKLAKDDPVGRLIEDSHLKIKRRKRRKDGMLS